MLHIGPSDISQPTDEQTKQYGALVLQIGDYNPDWSTWNYIGIKIENSLEEGLITYHQERMLRDRLNKSHWGYC